jgi:Domain of unknown function (DUF4160)
MFDAHKCRVVSNLRSAQRIGENLHVPTIKTIGPYRFFFASSDRVEPAHVHVEHEGRVAKFWLDPVRLSKSGRLSQHELRQIERLVRANRVEFAEAWYDFFGH